MIENKIDKYLKENIIVYNDVERLYKVFSRNKTDLEMKLTTDIVKLVDKKLDQIAKNDEITKEVIQWIYDEIGECISDYYLVKDIMYEIANKVVRPKYKIYDIFEIK